MQGTYCHINQRCLFIYHVFWRINKQRIPPTSPPPSKLIHNWCCWCKWWRHSTVPNKPILLCYMASVWFQSHETCHRGDVYFLTNMFCLLLSLLRDLELPYLPSSPQPVVIECPQWTHTTRGLVLSSRQSVAIKSELLHWQITTATEGGGCWNSTCSIYVVSGILRSGSVACIMEKSLCWSLSSKKVVDPWLLTIDQFSSQVFFVNCVSI